MIIQKQDESFVLLISESDEDNTVLQKINEFLKVYKPDAKYNFKVQRGWESPYHYFAETKKINNKIVLRIMSGHTDLLGSFGLDFSSINPVTEFTSEQISSTFKEAIDMMPFKPYDYQLKCAVESLLNPRQISLSCTSSGKSLMIFLIMYFLYKNNKKGYLIVPNINLLDQLYSDFGEYFKDEFSEQRDEFLSNIDKQGGGRISEFDSFLTISTWQSLMNRRDVLDRADFILCDESHRYSSVVASEIIQESKNAKYKWGLTGTLPEDEISKMTLLGLFGAPKRYIRACELIERGLGTPIEIITFFLNYSKEDQGEFSSISSKQYLKQLTFIKEHEQRNKFLNDLITKIKDSGSTLILGSHSEHIKGIYLNLMKYFYPDVEVQNKNITGKNSFDFQKEYGIFFMNGEDDAKTRDLTRRILEEKLYRFEYIQDTENSDKSYEIISQDDFINRFGFDLTEVSENKLQEVFKEHGIKNFNRHHSIIVSNFAVLSTGVNIKQLFNLVFASPLKAYTTITQSIGRGLRLHKDKSVFRVFDIVDVLKTGRSSVFMNQYKERKRHSYNSEGYPIVEREFNLF